MIKGHILSNQGFAHLKEMYEWWLHNRHKTNIQNPSRRSPPGEGGGTMKIFEVQSAATGDGVYNCYEQTLNTDNWTDTSGKDKFTDTNSTEIKVLNMYESSVLSAYERSLAKYDLLAAWLMSDKYVGIPLGTYTRQARAINSPGVSYIEIDLISRLGSQITSGLGHNLDAYFNITQAGSDLAAALPRPAWDDYLTVYNFRGKWYCTSLANPTVPCSY